MPVVTASDLKTKRFCETERLLQDAQEVVISVRGKPRYVVMATECHEFLRECEIAAVWAQARADLAAGRCRRESAGTHVARVEMS